jgi:hypothetical protein
MTRCHIKLIFLSLPTSLSLNTHCSNISPNPKVTRIPIKVPTICQGISLVATILYGCEVKIKGWDLRFEYVKSPMPEKFVNVTI